MQKLKKAVSAYVLALIFLASSWALFVPGFFRVHDFTHAGRIAEMTRALEGGQFPVRWTANFGYGYGMPLFEFYGPLPFYVGAALYWLGLGIVPTMKALYFLTNALTVVGGYLLGKKLYGRSGGIIVAGALTLAPYRAMNLFVRGALNETWAIAFLPWILLAVIQILHREKRAWLLLTLSLVGLFLSHNVMTLLFTPVLFVFALLYFLTMVWRKSPELYRKGLFRWRNFFRITGPGIGATLLAIGLSAFYMVPAFLEKSATQVESTILSSYFDYHLHFVYIRQFFTPFWGYGGSNWGVDDGISFFLGWGQWAGLVLLAVLLGWRVWQWLRKRSSVLVSQREGSLLVLLGGLMVGSLYLSILKSQWLWDAIPLLEYVQFPWRWLGIGIVFLSALVGGVSLFVKQRWARVFFTVTLVVSMVVGSAGSFRPETYLEDADAYYYTDEYRIRHNLSGILPDYIPAGMRVPPEVIPEGLVINAEALDAEAYEVLADRPTEKLLRTRFAEETLMSFSVAEYPGWRTEVDDQRWNRQQGADGNIELLVPPGNHFVTIRLMNTLVRSVADGVSAVSLVVLVFALLPQRPERKTV